MPGGSSERAVPVAAKKRRIQDLYAKGKTIRDICAEMQISEKSYDYYRRSDPEFKAKMDQIREFRDTGEIGPDRKPVPDFHVFSEKYLGAKVFPHQQQWIDLLEGREPIGLHHMQRYEKGFSSQHLVVNTPPGHAKSTTITTNYVTWRIVQNPDIKILVISSNATNANKFLYAIKMRLDTSRAFMELKRDFAPVEGYDGGNAIWRNDMIYVNQNTEESTGEKDPTVQALGIGKKIYGARADLIILDDVVDSSNAHDFENQIDWIQNILQSRIDADDGKILVVGTRLATQDLYSEIMKPEYYDGEEVPWTYLSQPAVLEMPDANSPETWTTLWPRSNQRPRGKSFESLSPDEDGLFPKWSGPQLSRKRRGMSPRNWSMVYQQEQVASDAIFSPTAINGCTSSRRPGPLLASPLRPAGMHGLTVVAGLDPAAAGHTAAVVIGLDRSTGQRFVLDVFNQSSLNYNEIIQTVKDWTVKYNVQEWRIEKNNVQAWLVQDEGLNDFLRSRGVIARPHFTHGNKWDADFGVASMANLFDKWETNQALIDLPSSKGATGIQALREQLITWFPDTKGKTDIVMALWFAEIRCRELMNEGGMITHWVNPMFTTSRGEAQSFTVDIDDLVARGWA